MRKVLNVKVTTAESQLEFEILKSAPGQQLFDQVVRTIGLREVWFFGIQYTDKNNNPAWLQLNKKISSHSFAPNATNDFKFMVKYYPENVAEELIQPITIRHFYLQVKNDIMNGKIYCSTETSVLLASFACVVKHSNNCPPSLPISRLVTVREKYNLTDEEWYDRIIAYYKDHKDMSTEDAMRQYLQLAQDLETYGVEKFPIKNKRGTVLCLGVDALGLSVYDDNESLNPKIAFPWSEIRNLSFKDKRFVIKPTDVNSKEFYFLVDKTKTNQKIIDLCLGNHDLYMRRRKTDSIEVQQMKIQAKEDREQKEQERQKLIESQKKLEAMQEQFLRKADDYEEMTVKLTNFQNKIAELENRLREESESRAALEVNKEQLYGMNLKLQQETTASAEERAKLLSERDKIQNEINYQNAALKQREAEKLAAESELQRLRSEQQAFKVLINNKHGDDESVNDENEDGCQEDANNETRELEVIPNIKRPEESRTTEVSRNENLQVKLDNLKSDLTKLRDDSKMTKEDKKHEINVLSGTDKYKTLRSIRLGNTKLRVEQFESM